MTSETSSMVSLRGVDMPLIRRGSGPPVLVLHGGDGPVDHLPFAERISGSFELLHPTHPGFDGTPIPEHFDGLQDLIFLYLDLIDSLDLQDAILVGFSMGGWLASEIAVMSTGRFSKLVLVDSVGIKPGGPFDRDIADVFALSVEELLQATWHDRSLAPLHGQMTDAELQIIASDKIAHGLYTWEPYMHNPKLRYRLHRIDIPTLLIWGENDGIVKTEYGAALRDLIPGARMSVIPEAGHHPHIEQPGEFAARFLDFVSG
ncbi:MAG: alpha/beta hydrolase [Chloroflexi bacterium]|nr:alpha/beta hydrolase [Chloroflexota bacterium]